MQKSNNNAPETSCFGGVLSVEVVIIFGNAYSRKLIIFVPKKADANFFTFAYAAQIFRVLVEHGRCDRYENYNWHKCA